MSAISAIDLECPYESAPGIESAPDLSPPRRHTAGPPRRRILIECAAAAIAGTLMAIGWAALASPSDPTAARRLLLERELAQLSSPLAEFARLERAAESARASTAAVTARARPYVELRSLLEVLSSEAHAGVTVTRLQQTREGFELQVAAVDGAACASWVERLARIPGLVSVDLADLKLAAAPTAGQAGGSIAAVVRLRWDASPQTSPSRRAVADDGRASGGDE
ncbi:type II secretion system protein GspM [Trinickia acidisoli]|uniref:type II secretion system protein GspM n=1 Tax=Trinickia acidisoli TaxID=2767482 RepID=UPI001A9047DC|nr:type II secretion system protein GspM [Trinickia acidisoli]